MLFVHFAESGEYCSQPLNPPGRCPVPWYRPEHANYYWDSSVGNCQPYFNNEGGCSSSSSTQNGYENNVYNTYEDCMSGCASQNTGTNLGKTTKYLWYMSVTKLSD